MAFYCGWFACMVFRGKVRYSYLDTRACIFFPGFLLCAFGEREREKEVPYASGGCPRAEGLRYLFEVDTRGTGLCLSVYASVALMK